VIKKEFEDTFTVIPNTISILGDNNGELSVLGVHKATAIEKVIQHLNIDKEYTFAYGDGMNDIEMLEFVKQFIISSKQSTALCFLIWMLMIKTIIHVFSIDYG